MATRRTKRALVVLAAAAIALRVIYFVQLNATPLIDLHRWDQTDMNYYDRWGQAIAGGDWLSRGIGVPMHSWHEDVAREYLASHPAERATLESRAIGTGQTVEARLWAKWMGTPRFYEDPLYPYLLGATYRFFGHDVRYAFGWQSGCGVLTVLLIYTLTLRFFGKTAATIAGVLAILCSTLMYYELILLREALITFAGLALVWIACEARERRRWPWFLLLGAAAGLACLLKSTFIALGLVLAAWTLWPERRERRAALQFASACAVGAVLSLAPLVARNIAVGVPPFAFASSGPLTFIASNTVDYPVDTGFGIDTPHVAALMGETYDRPVRAVLSSLRQHSASSFATMFWRKFDRTWHWYEIPNNDNFSYMRLQVPVLSVLPFTFWICGSVGLVGVFVALVRTHRPWPLLALVAATLAPLLVFYVLGRFRVGLLAALIPFAGLAVGRVAEWLRTRRFVAALLTIAAAGAVGAWTGRALDHPTIRPIDWMTPFVVRYQAEVQAAITANDPGGAAAAFMRFFRYEPDTGQLTVTASRQLALDLGAMHRDCAELLNESGQADASRQQAERSEWLLRLAGVQ